MDAPRFDAMTRRLGSSRSRRLVLRTIAGIALAATLAAPRQPAVASPIPSGCMAGGASCKKNGHCCSGRCKKKRGKRKGRCTSLGRYAANCPPVHSCLSDEADWFCSAGSGGGVCIAGPSGQPFCVSRTACNTPDGSPICATDADCGAAHVFGPEFAHKGKCLTCAKQDCSGGVMCALYAGDDPR